MNTSTSSKKIGVGVIGGSVNNGWAKATHIPAIQQLPNLELSAVCTTQPESAEQSAKEFHAKHAFVSADQLSQHPDVDMVVVSVKVHKHYDAVKAAVSAGKAVYCEWPLGSTTAQAVEMQQWVETNQVHHAVGLQARQSPEINYVKDLVADGFIGNVLSVNMKIYTEIMGGTGFQGAAYIFDKKVGGNLLTIYGGHSLDALTYILGDFKQLSATMARQYRQATIVDTNEVIEKTTDDQIVIAGTLTSGAVASVHIQGGIKHQSGVFIEIFGDNGTIVLTSPNSIQMGPHTVLGARSAEGEAAQLQEMAIPDSYVWVPDAIKATGGRVLNVAQALSKFTEDLQEGAQRMPDFEAAVKVHKLLDAVVKAAETGERQYL